MEDKKADAVKQIDDYRVMLEKTTKRVQGYTTADLDRIIEEGREKQQALAIQKRRELRKAKEKVTFEDRVGVDLYNLDESVAKFIKAGQSPLETEQEKGGIHDLIDFFRQHSVGPHLLESLIVIPDKINKKELTAQLQQPYREFEAQINSESATFITTLPKELTKYRALVEKAINGEKPTEEEIKFIQQRFRHSTSITWLGNDNGGSLREVPSIGIDGIFGHAYRFVYRLWNSEVKAQICAAADCGKLFIPTPRGRDQLYCSDRCYKRTYMRKRRRRLKEKVPV